MAEDEILLLLLVLCRCQSDKPHTTHNSSIRSDEGLTLETSAFESLYGGQLSTLGDKTKHKHKQCKPGAT